MDIFSKSLSFTNANGCRTRKALLGRANPYKVGDTLWRDKQRLTRFYIGTITISTHSPKNSCLPTMSFELAKHSNEGNDAALKGRSFVQLPNWTSSSIHLQIRSMEPIWRCQGNAIISCRLATATLKTTADPLQRKWHDYEKWLQRISQSRQQQRQQQKHQHPIPPTLEMPFIVQS